LEKAKKEDILKDNPINNERILMLRQAQHKLVDW